MKTAKAKPELCGEVFGGLTWMPCVKPEGHSGMHHGECNEPSRVGSMDWHWLGELSACKTKIREVTKKKVKVKP